MNSASVIAFQAVVMFVLLFVGWLLYKNKLLSDEATKQLSNIAISIIYPIVIFNSYQTELNAEMVRGLLWSLALGAASQLLLVLIPYAVVRSSSENCAVERFAMAYSNCAFMGIPLIEATFGSEGVFYLTGYITMFNIFSWTHGVIMMRGGEKKSASETAKFLLKVLCSPSIIAVALGLVFFFTGLRLPRIIQLPLDYLGSMNTPLAMLVSGATIAKAGLLKAFRNKRVYFVQAFKLLIIPAVLAAAFIPLRAIGIDPVITNTVLIAASAPTASATIMFAYKYGRNAEYSSNHFALSTVLSIITLPGVLLLSDFFASVMLK